MPDSSANPNSENFNKAKALQPGFNVDDRHTWVDQRYQESYPVKKYGQDSSLDDAPQNLGDGVPSLANRYSLFQYRGFTHSNFLAD
ncbi:MAG: hypothetical protein ACFFKA_10335, partial [Candidatus Thorarchaeota archaeon]